MLKVGGKFEGVVIGAEAPRFKHRWFGVLEIMIDGSTYKFYMSGTIAQWFAEGDRVIVLVKKKEFLFLLKVTRCRKQKMPVQRSWLRVDPTSRTR